MTTFHSVSAVADWIATLPATPSRRFIGITGAPGAGKSTIAQQLVAELPDAALLPMDGYHLPQSRLVELGRRERMGAPDTFDVDGFLTTLQDLRVGGGPVFAPGFDRDREEAVADAIRIAPETGTVVVEGNYLLLDADGWGAVAGLLDLALFVELDRDLRHERLIARHIAHGKSPEAARAWALGPDERNAALIQATAARADHRIRLD